MALAIFTPELGDIYGFLGLFGGGFLLLVVLAVYFGKSQDPDPRKRVLLPMLAYFFALLALMGTLGSFWSLFKFPTVEIENKQLTIDGEAYGKPASGAVRFQDTPGGRVLLVQTPDYKTWAFPSDRYAVGKMYGLLKE